MAQNADGRPFDRRGLPARLRVAALLGAVLVFYLWTASSSTAPFAFSFSRSVPDSYAGALADSFLHGQLSLRVNPRPELLALDDPYDPVANGKFRLHDASLYKGRYFAYFTPAPALLFIAPVRALTGYFLPTSLLTALLCFAGFVFSLLVLAALLRSAGVEASGPTWLASAVALATANAVPFLLRRPEIYELSIASGYAFLMAGTWSLVTGLAAERDRLSWRLMTASGVSLGLCILSRPTQLFACAILPAAFLLARRIVAGDSVRASLRAAACLLWPIALIGAAMCWYNYARFGSILEFGVSYQLAGLHPHRVAVFAPIYVPLGVYHYLFQAIPFDLRFPFFHIAAPTAPIDIPFPYFYEPTAGLLAFPVYWLLAPALPALRSLWRLSPAFLLMSLSMTAASAASLFAVAGVVASTMRYVVDFSPLLLIATLALFLAARPLVFASAGPGRTVGRMSYHLFVALSVLMSVAISMTGYYDRFSHQNPELYRKLERALTVDFGALARRFPPIPSIPGDVPSTPRILAISSPDGTPPGPNGLGLAIGRTETTVEVYSPRSAIAHFRATARPGPPLADYVRCRIQIATDAAAQDVSIGKGQQAFDFAVAVHPGRNVITLLALDLPQRAAAPGRDADRWCVWSGELRLVGIGNP
jgi:hypothetical protein